jgi:Ca2+/Na+ antiporter
LITKRYWLLFWIAVAMAAHSAVVGRLLGSSFFMLLFFWGWVAAAAYRGQLESAKSMAIVMVILLTGTAVALAFQPVNLANDLAYYTFALYPALVSWICVYFYVRHLLQRDANGVPMRPRPAPQRRAV